MTESSSKYTKPELRKKVVAEVKAGSAGGKPGQWSARKAQIASKRYEDRGGGYKGGKGKEQKKLSKWSGEKWRTSDGSKSEGKKRYLPDKAWSKLSDKEKQATNRKKAEGNAKGKQYVSNTKKAKAASKSARKGK